MITNAVKFTGDGGSVLVRAVHEGTEVQITVTSVLQTPAGRMIFGRVESRSATG